MVPYKPHQNQQTQNIQETSTTHADQRSTGYSTLEELLNTTTDEELEFLESSWNSISSPDFSGINTSNIQLPAARSLHSPPVNSMAQTSYNVNSIVQTPSADLMYQLPPGINPVAQPPAQTKREVNSMTQPYPQSSHIPAQAYPSLHSPITYLHLRIPVTTIIQHTTQAPSS